MTRMSSPLQLSGVLALTLLTACFAHVPQRGSGEAPSEGRLITAEEIDRSGARTAWEALRQVTPVSMRETAAGKPRSISMRGHSSVHLDDTPVVIVDGVPIDLDMLRNIDARTIARIEILNGVQGTLRFGTGSGGGAIVITTRSR